MPQKNGYLFNKIFAVAVWCVAYSIEHNGNSPSHREIAAHFNTHPSNAAYYLECMFKFGIAERVDGKLIIIGSQYLPPAWYVANLDPPVSETNQIQNARRNHHIVKAPSKQKL